VLLELLNTSRCPFVNLPTRKSYWYDGDTSVCPAIGGAFRVRYSAPARFQTVMTPLAVSSSQAPTGRRMLKPRSFPGYRVVLRENQLRRSKECRRFTSRKEAESCGYLGV